MGFKFGKCKQLTTLKEQSLATTAPDFIDFEGCDELTTLSGTESPNRYGALNNTKAVTVSFKNCAKLTTIGSHMLHMVSGVASNLESIDFTGCIGLKTIGSYFLSQSTNIHSDKITKIDLSPCVNLTSIGMCFCPSCTELVELDMHGLTKLTTFSGDNNDSEANDKARGASRCPKLAKVDMSGCLSLEYIGSFAFAFCQALSDVNLTGCSSLKYLRMGCFSGASDAENTIETIIGWEEVKHQIEFIGTQAFRDNEHLNIDISHMENLKTIAHGSASDKPYGAFTRCTSLRSCPNNCPALVTIGMYAFTNCTNLGLNDDGTFATLDLSNNTNLTTIGTSAFEGVKAIETINLDNDTSLASLGNRCFYGNTELKHFYARNCTSLTSIGSSMLFGSTKLLDARFGGCTSLSTIGGDALTQLKQLLYIEFPENAPLQFENSACRDSGLSTLRIDTREHWIQDLTTAQVSAGLINDGDPYLSTSIKSNAIKKIGYQSFQKNRLIEYLNCDDSPITQALQTNICNASSIYDISIKNAPNYTRIDSGFAWNCKMLEKADYTGTSITYIDEHVFDGDNMLKSFIVDDVSIITNINAYAFNDTWRIDADSIEWNCPLLIKAGSHAFYRSSFIKSITAINAPLADIGDFFASMAPNLETVDFTNCKNIAAIYPQAFNWCPNLRSVNFSGCDALALIGYQAFLCDTALVSCNLSDCPITKLDQQAFDRCVHIENIDLDSSNIQTINTMAFQYCTSLKTLKLHQDDTQECKFYKAIMGGLRNAMAFVDAQSSWTNNTTYKGSPVTIVDTNVPTYPLDIYIYGSTPATIAEPGIWNFINGVNNNGCQVTIHMNNDAKDLYLTVAKIKEDEAHARTTTDPQMGKDVVWYWCCSNGQATATTGGTTPVEGNFQCAGWYATSIATTPTVVFDL